ncbi:MAG TPA: YbaK/EbsC family protein [Gaiellaceae bacterium]|nr:YbaK/EbsC family protein [Gaiellaceae bacterium]
MVGAWPEPVERVSSFLRDAGVDARIEEFPDGTASAQDAADAVGCELAQIVKSLVFVCDERTVVALVPGDRRGDVEKVAAAVGASSARIAKADEVEEATGFAPGAVAPFPLPKIDTVLMDQAFYRYDVVWAGAGSHRHVMGISPTELGRLARVRPMDVAAEQPYDSSKPKES